MGIAIFILYDVSGEALNDKCRLHYSMVPWSCAAEHDMKHNCIQPGQETKRMCTPFIVLSSDDYFLQGDCSNCQLTRHCLDVWEGVAAGFREPVRYNCKQHITANLYMETLNKRCFKMN